MMLHRHFEQGHNENMTTLKDVTPHEDEEFVSEVFDRIVDLCHTVITLHDMKVTVRIDGARIQVLDSVGKIVQSEALKERQIVLLGFIHFVAALLNAHDIDRGEVMNSIGALDIQGIHHVRIAVDHSGQLVDACVIHSVLVLRVF